MTPPDEPEMIEQLRAHAEELTDLTIRLEQTLRELDAFTSAVSHDLRAPLRSLSRCAGMLRADYGDRLDDVGHSYLDKMDATVARMATMLDDLLRLAQIGRGELQLTDVDLAELAHTSVRALQAADPTRVVDVRIAPDLHVRGDARLLQIVFDNLVGNAWKYTSTKPTATIELGRSDATTFFLRDDGIGFDMRESARLFLPFQRLASARALPGTGVGLATVERIVKRHGGRIWADSELGKGATFWLTLGV